MSVIHSFAPIVGNDPHTLILGSMPGVASLQAGRYYAHPRNAFWPIMGELVGAGPELEYSARTTRLEARGIAVWDVLKLCTREGSLDSAIVESSIEPNDFAALFGTYPSIERVFFNGAKAADTYRRHVAKKVDVPHVTFLRLPSTSPAHASMNAAAKLDAWRAVLP